jgi:hypothetical protein
MVAAASSLREQARGPRRQVLAYPPLPALTMPEGQALPGRGALQPTQSPDLPPVSCAPDFDMLAVR